MQDAAASSNELAIHVLQKGKVGAFVTLSKSPK